LGAILALLFVSCGPKGENEGVPPNVPQKAQKELSGEIEQGEKPPVTEEELKRYQALLKDPHTVIRLAAARVLLAYGDRSGEEVLLEALKRDDTRHRIDAFLALSAGLTEETTPVLQKIVDDEKNPMARYVMKRTLKKALKEFKLRRD